MKIPKTRRGFTLWEFVLVLFGLAGIAAVVVCVVWTLGLRADVRRIDDKGKQLTAWIGRTDNSATNNFLPNGLTSYLIDLSDHLSRHEHLTIAGGAHAPGPPDSHLDPPPPPPW